MPFIALPDEINLKSADYKDLYRQAKIKITGKSPDEFIEKVGEPMVYGITVPKNAPNREAAIRFVAFVITFGVGAGSLGRMSSDSNAVENHLRHILELDLLDVDAIKRARIFTAI